MTITWLFWVSYAMLIGAIISIGLKADANEKRIEKLERRLK